MIFDSGLLLIILAVAGAAAGLAWATGFLSDPPPNGKTCYVSGCGEPAVWIVGTTPYCAEHAAWAEKRARK